MNHSQSLQYNGWLPIFSWPRAQNKNTAQFALHRLDPVFCLLCCFYSELQRHISISSLLQYADLPEEELDSKAGVVAGEAARISQFYSLLTSSIDVIYKFCDRIPGFNDLCKQDRELLFR